MARYVWVGLAVLAVLSLAAGTGGFSSASVDRSVSVSVVDNEDAFTALYDPGSHGDGPPPAWLRDSTNTPRERPVHGEERTTLFHVANQFGGVAIRVDATVPAGATPTVTDIGGVTLTPGEVGEVTGMVECPSTPARSHHTVDLTVTVDGEGDSLSATIDYEVTLLCAGTPTQSDDAAEGQTSPAPE